MVVNNYVINKFLTLCEKKQILNQYKKTIQDSVPALSEFIVDMLQVYDDYLTNEIQKIKECFRITITNYLSSASNNAIFHM